MISMAVTRDPTDPRVLIVSDGDPSERALWIGNELAMLAGLEKSAAHVRGGVRIDAPADARTEAEIRADTNFDEIYVEDGAV